MFKRENLRKNFLRVKQNIDQNLGRAEKSEVLSEDQQENEKRVDVVKHAFQNIAKKAGAVLQAPGTEFEKRLKKLPETGLGNAMVESATALGLDTLLGSVCQLCGDAQLNLAREQVQYDVTVEQEFVTPLQNIVDIDIPSIIKFRKALNKSTLDMDSAKTRYNQAVRQSHVPGANIANAMAKADVINEEYEEASQKVESIKDNLSIELCNFAAKESEHSNRLLLLLEAQATYHKKALEAIEGCIPQMRLAIQNSPTKPCYGMPLEEHLRLMCRDIAVVLEACITTLLEFGMEEEGLFRIAGAAMKLKKLKACFDAHAVDMEEFHTDPHTVAGALKQYLRELPEPLLTYALYEDFMQTANLPQDQRLQKLWTVISRLPTPNYNNFRYLVKFLSKLAEKSDVNKMKPSNIAIVIGPNLLWSEKNNAPNMLSTGTVSAIIEAIVTHADWFFPGAYDFQLTGHGSSPKPCREPGFTFNAKSELAKTTEKAETNVKESVQEGEKEGRGNGDGSEGGDKAKIITTEKGGLSPKVEFQIAKPNLAVAETEDSEGSSSDENNPFSEKYEAKNQGVTESDVQNGKLEKDFDFTNVGYHYEEDQEREQTEVEKPNNNSNALHVQAVSNQPPSLQASPGSPVVSAADSSSDSLPVPSDSLELSSPVLRRVARKPAPPPPPERPFTVMVTATTGLPGNDNSTSSYNQCQTWPRSTPAPLASPESPTEQHKTANPENRQSVRLSSGHSERPSVPPPERPGQAPPDRPRLPPSLNPPVGKGHQRSASTGAMVHQSVGSFDSSHVAGLPNAGSLSSYSISEGNQEEANINQGVGFKSASSAANTQPSVGPGSSNTLGRHSSMRPRPTPPPPPPPLAKESEQTKL